MNSEKDREKERERERTQGSWVRLAICFEIPGFSSESLLFPSLFQTTLPARPSAFLSPMEVVTLFLPCFTVNQLARRSHRSSSIVG